MIDGREVLRLRLDALVREAMEVDRLFEAGVGRDLEGGYPPYLPSFDAVVIDLIRWRDAVGERVAQGAARGG